MICLFTAAAAAQVPASGQFSGANLSKDPTRTDPVKDAAYEPLSKAFAALKNRDYDPAIAFFRTAASLSPDRADIRKNLAYTLLKTGETEAARQQFGEAVRIDPADFHVALEYAFLCYEARDEAPARKAEARRIFAHVRDAASDPTLRATATQAFQNIDEPLIAAIARWQQALATSKPNFSAHFELAQLAEQHGEPALAAANYKAAFRLLPERKSVLIELARAEKAAENPEGMMAALLTASRSAEPRAAELARELLPARYPYVYEFRKALELDPANDTLHRELAWLLLSMSEKGGEAPSSSSESKATRDDAEKEFQQIVTASPDDYLAAAQLGLLYLEDHRDDLAMPILKTVLANGDSASANRVRMALHMPLVLEDRNNAAPAPSALDPRVLGERSYAAGFLKDARRYFTQAYEANPIDSAVPLKLGWTLNMLHDDQESLRWFRLARQSSDPAIRAEADKAYKNLKPANELLRTTVWIYPLYSTRWSDVFGYGQAKTEMRLGKLPFRPYATVRFVGDVRQNTGGLAPQSLSESAFILGVGVATRQWRRTTAWFEAGGALSYLNGTHWKDFRGGVSYSRTFGSSLAAETAGMFFESTADSVFVSHFGDDLINYSQNKAGYMLPVSFKGTTGFKTQTFWTTNVTTDLKRQYWANFVETGPGFRFHPPGAPPSVSVTFNALRGVYLINAGNPRRPNFNDFRVGVWYAFTK